MKKVAIAVVVLLILLPVLPKLIPNPLTMESVTSSLKAKGFSVTDDRKVTPQNGAIDQMTMTINGAMVELYQFDDEGKIAVQMEYNKTDAGTAIVETWNLSETLGAAKSKNKPCQPARNGMFMIVVTSDDKSVNARIASAFEKL
jgi:hypothetical protein